MINKLEKILNNYHVTLEEGIPVSVRFLSKNDLKKIVRLDKGLLMMEDFAEISIFYVLRIKEEIFFDVFITVRRDTLFVLIESVYIPIELSCDRFNSVLYDCGRAPNRFYITREKCKDYLRCWWDKALY